MKKITDERIAAESMKQNSLGFAILYFGLLMDLLYRQFIRLQPIEEIWDLLLLFFGVSFYMAVKKVFAGFYVHKNKKVLFITPLLAGIVFTSVQYFFLKQTGFIELMVGFIVFYIVFVGIQSLMFHISKRKNDKLLEE